MASAEYNNVIELTSRLKKSGKENSPSEENSKNYNEELEASISRHPSSRAKAAKVAKAAVGDVVSIDPNNPESYIDRNNITPMDDGIKVAKEVVSLEIETNGLNVNLIKRLNSLMENKENEASDV